MGSGAYFGKSDIQKRWQTVLSPEREESPDKGEHCTAESADR